MLKCYPSIDVIPTRLYFFLSTTKPSTVNFRGRLITFLNPSLSCTILSTKMVRLSPVLTIFSLIFFYESMLQHKNYSISVYSFFIWSRQELKEYVSCFWSYSIIKLADLLLAMRFFRYLSVPFQSIQTIRSAGFTCQLIGSFWDNWQPSQ